MPCTAQPACFYSGFVLKQAKELLSFFFVDPVEHDPGMSPTPNVRPCKRGLREITRKVEWCCVKAYLSKEGFETQPRTAPSTSFT